MKRVKPTSEKKGAVSLFMDTVSGVFGPIVPAIAGAGMIKGSDGRTSCLKCNF
jgi:PTS system beta-glucosides-specific IIC component